MSLESKGLDVSVIDIGWFGKSNSQDYQLLDIANFDVVIHLAGHSSVSMAQVDSTGAWQNNVIGFHKLCTQLEESQTLIYASSGSVYGNSGKGVPLEESQTSLESMNVYDMTKIVSDTVANQFIQTGKNIVGLRFGTVNGISPQTRTDLLLNSMMDTAITSGFVSVTNGHINRAVLFLSDLENAMLNVIEAPTSGIYNLASLNLTVMRAAEAVSDLVGADIRVSNGDANYDFALDVSKFVDTFGEFRVAEIEAELEKLREGLPIVSKSRRSGPGTQPLLGV